MEVAAYRRLLLRLIVLPIVALALLALTLAYGLQRVQESTRQVDHADQVIALANYLLRLIVDEESGLRGFLHSRDQTFLEPFQKASKEMDPAFATLFGLETLDPQQTARLQSLKTAFQAWQQDALQAIAEPTPADEVRAHMRGRKLQMDHIRALADNFISAETQKRNDRSTTALKVDRVSLYGLISLAMVLGLFLAWEIRRLFQKLANAYDLQIKEVRRWGDECYAREQWLNTTLRSIGDAVIACDPTGNVVFMNGVAEQLTGWKETEVQGLPMANIFVIVNQRTRAAVENPVDVVRRSGKVVGLANHNILISREQKEFHIDDSAAPILDKDSHLIGIVLVFRDISERYASQIALLRTEKLASAGRLAAAIAHEVNNPLEGLVNLVYLARNESDIQKVRLHLTEADRELQRIAHITRQSLGFYRENTAALLFRPDVVTQEVFDFYSFRANNAHIALHVDIRTNQTAFGNAGELRQVLSNLLANSLDACRPGDAICVRVHASRSPRNPTLQGVRITVADNGCGISRENLQRIFEPFFTTKKDTGTGLGLWVSRELMEKHGGRLTVRSNTHGSPTGTVFSLFLPGSAAGSY